MQTQARRMWAATRSLQLFIMKGIHCLFLAPPQSTQFSHTGHPTLLFTPCILFSPLAFSPCSLISPVLGRRRTERAQGRERGAQQIRGTAWRAAWGPRLSLLLPPVPSTGRGLCTQERLLYLGICGARLGGWRVGWGGGGGRRRPRHLFSSQAICSVSPGLPGGPQRTHTHANKSCPPAH